MRLSLLRRAGHWLSSIVGIGLMALTASASPPAATSSSEPSSDYSKRVVAYINGTTSVTREQLGEYLIARYGAEKLELLVNKLVIDRACQERGITVTAAEVDAAVADDAKSIQIDTKTFVDQVLKRYRKTLYEWKEDVIRPRLLLTKLCQDRVKVEDDDLRKAFEGRYGEKVEGRLILWPRGEERIARQLYAKLRDSEPEFAGYATHQANTHLAASGGKIKPMGRFSAENPQLEQEVFRLQPGDCTALIDTPEGIVMFRCDKRLPPENKKLEDVRADLTKEIFDHKVQKEIPKVFAELRKQADPVLILKNPETPEDIRHSTERLLKETSDVAKPSPAPVGN